MEEFWNDVKKVLLAEEEEDGYGIEDPRLVNEIVDQLSDPDEMADFIYTFHKKLNG